jgi:hypothetical protein
MARSSTSTDADVTLRAKEMLFQLESGSIDRSKLSSGLNADMTDFKLGQISAKLGLLGQPLSFTPEGSREQNGLTVYTYRVQFRAGVVTETFVLDTDGKVAGIWFKPGS